MQPRQDLRMAPTPPRLVDTARSASLPVSPHPALVSPAWFSGSPAALRGLRAGAGGTDRPEWLPSPLLEALQAHQHTLTQSTRAHTHVHKSAPTHSWAARCTQVHTCSQACTYGHMFTQASCSHTLTLISPAVTSEISTYPT